MQHSTHTTPAVRVWLAAHPRVTLHFTATTALWPNAVEGSFALLERRAIRRGSFASVAELRAELRRFIAGPQPGTPRSRSAGRKTAAVILDKAQGAEHALRIDPAGH